MDFFAQLTPNTLLLTPNSRLSAVFLKKYDAWQQAQAKTAWQSLDILPINTWLLRLWLNYTATQIAATPLLLSSNQEQLVWEEILRHSAEGDYLLQLSNTAELAKSAWATLKQWQVDFDNPALKTTEDSFIFQKWAAQFKNLCQKNAWLDVNSIVDHLVEKIRQQIISAPDQIILIGFTEITPQQQFLLSCFETIGTKLKHFNTVKENNTVNRISLMDEENEIRTMARWAKQIYSHNSTATVGCVIPRLQDMRNRVLQIFSEVFSQGNTYTFDHTQLPFNISAGKNLSLYPIIHCALQLLALSVDNITLETLSELLRSPFIGEAEQEMFARAQLEEILRRKNMSTTSLKRLIHFKAAKKCPALLKRLEKFISVKSPKKSLVISQWIAFFMEKLTHLGWPGERSLDSFEYQSVQAWLKTLTEFAGYEKALGEVTYQQALHYLNYLTTKKIFQPESPEAPIQILGALEAAEIPFNYLWVMGLDDTTWPQAPKPNPFIPQRLQKILNMPHATAERELIFTKRLTEQLQHSADTVIFSHALIKEDAELRPSPLLTKFPEITLNELTLADFTAGAQFIFNTRALEILQDEIAPPIQDHEKIRGGSAIFKHQAACPFKAFAELRLQAKKLESPTIGLRPQERGEIVHKTMELIWQSLKDRHTLLLTPPDALKILIQNCVEKAIQEYAEEISTSKRYLALESLRLQKLISEWLEQESLRPPFRIHSLEEEHEIKIHDILVKIRADRIDELENGKKIIIDYKTGKTNPTRDWFGDRPNEPQLPLYCITDPTNITGILFAQINAEEMKWKGISETQLDIEAVKTLDEKNDYAPTWQAQIQAWQQTLEKLAAEFTSGHAEVYPKNPVETCQHCHLHTLCRIHEVVEK